MADKLGHLVQTRRLPMGGNSIDSHGDPLPEETRAACRTADAILLGGVGGPKWDDPQAKTRPEAGLLRIRKELGLFANLRPISPSPHLLEASPLKASIISGTDILFVRELTGGLYFGSSGRRSHASGEEAFSTMVYNTAEIERVVRVAAHAPRNRKGRLTMVDKANAPEASR